MLDVLGLSIGLVVGALFLASGLQKIRTGDIVESAVRYEILPDRIVAVLLPALPWIEVGLGILVLCGILATYALLAAASLLTLFAIGMAINLVKGRRIDCGCRAAQRPISWRLVVENLGLAAAAGLAALTQSPAPLRELIGGGTPTLTTSEVLIVILLVSQGVLFYGIALAVGPIRRRLQWFDNHQAIS